MIAVRQINQTELNAAIAAAITGGNFSGMLNAYTAASGYLGPTILYVSGGDQLVHGVKAFESSPLVPFSGANTGSAASQAYVDQKIVFYIDSLSGTITGGFVTLADNQTILGYKIFTGAVGVGVPTQSTHAVPYSVLTYVSGLLQSGIENVTVADAVTLDTDQTVTGRKTFVVSPYVPIPTNPSGAVPLSMLTGVTVGNTVFTTGNQTISGIKTYVQSPLVPLATLPNQAVNLQQLNALGVSMGGVTGFGGVQSLNGSTGSASGAVYLQGAGTVTITQCGAIFYVSGFTANNTQLYSVQIPLASGATGGSFTFPTGSGQAFGTLPTITTTLAVTGSPAGFMRSMVYGATTGGFNIAFESGIPGDGYVLNVNAIPAASGTGFFGIQGADGRAGASLSSRGVWLAGTVYSNRDWVYQPTVAASYVCTQTHISTAFNAPAGTGSANWAIMSTGTRGPTGLWSYNGIFNTGVAYSYGQSATQNGSTYGYTGVSPISGISPDTQTGGWTILAKQADVGVFINSGIITGNFVNLSFFLEPVATGLNAAEAFVSRTFQYTGYALGCVTSGTAPEIGNFILSGNVYVRELNNTKTILHSFTFNTGVYSYVSGNLAYTVTGMNRMGVDLTSTLSGISKFSVGLFGFGMD